MNFDAILKYQKLDEKLAALDKAFNASPIVIEYNKANKLFNEAKEQYTKLSKKYNDFSKELEGLLKDFEKLQDEINDSENLENSYTKSEEMKYPITKLNDLLKELDILEKKISSSKSNIKNIDEEIQAVTYQASKQMQTVNKYTQQYNNQVATRKGIQQETIEEKQTLESSIDPELLDKYKTQAATGKAKVVFEATPGNPMCPSCYKHMGNAIDGLKNPGDYITCPECGAILIIK